MLLLYCKYLRNLSNKTTFWVIIDTVIGEGAFKDCTSLESIDIPNSVTEIGEVAFEDCTSLKSIHSTIEKVDGVVIEGDAFNGIDMNECTLYIPAGTRWAYRHHKVFGQFKNIEIESKWTVGKK